MTLAEEEELSKKMAEANRKLMEINRVRTRFLTRLMIAINAGIIILIEVILGIVLMITIKPDSSQGVAAIILVSLAIAIIGWSQILFRTRVFDYFFINVKQNWVVVLGNQMDYDDLPPNPEERIKLFERGALREVGQGIRGKLPWEIIVELVNLKSDVVIGSKKTGKPLAVYTEDDIELECEYQVVLTPLVGCTVNLIRRNEDAVVAYFTGIFEQRLISWMKQHKEGEVFKEIADLKAAFENTLGGNNRVHHEEIAWGVFTNTPQVISIKRGTRYQQAAEGTKIGMKMAGEIERINKQFDGLPQPDPNMVLATAAATVGNQVPGLTLIPGLGDAIKNNKALGAILGLAAKPGEKPSKK